MIELLKFRPSKDLDKAIQDLANKINEIINSVNKTPVHGSVDTTSGKAGDMRIVEVDDSNVKLALRGKNGWHETDAIKIKEKT